MDELISRRKVSGADESWNEMNLIWKPLKFARGETAMFGSVKLGIIRHRGNIWRAYVGNKKLTDSKSKKEALKRVLEEIAIHTQGKLF